VLKIFSSKAWGRGARSADDYATAADFCRHFTDHADSLYLLALLLTADGEKAEHCFLTTIEDCLGETVVFRDWMHSWAKRTMIKTGIKIVLGSENRATLNAGIEGFEDALLRIKNLVATLAKLDPFDRLVYVMSILEKISDRECALLLDCSVRDVLDAKVHALKGTSDAQPAAATLSAECPNIGRL